MLTSAAWFGSYKSLNITINMTMNITVSIDLLWAANPKDLCGLQHLNI